MHQALNGCDFHLGRRLYAGHVHFLEIIDLIEGLQFLQARFLEFIAGLLTEGVSIHHEEDAPESLSLNQPINQAYGQAGFAGSRRHGNQ